MFHFLFLFVWKVKTKLGNQKPEVLQDSTGKSTTNHLSMSTHLTFDFDQLCLNRYSLYYNAKVNQNILFCIERWIHLTIMMMLGVQDHMLSLLGDLFGILDDLWVFGMLYLVYTFCVWTIANDFQVWGEIFGALDIVFVSHQHFWKVIAKFGSQVCNWVWEFKWKGRHLIFANKC